MQTYVISLTTAVDRRKHIEKEFLYQNIPFKFFDAVTPNLVPDLVKKFNLDIQDSYLTGGELGCLLSHIMLWQKMVDESIPYMAIFEDDIYLSDGTYNFILSESWIPESIMLIKLEKLDASVCVDKNIRFSYQNHSFYTLLAKHIGSAGYILSLDGAKNLLKLIHSIKELLPVDEILFDICIRRSLLSIVQISPALCMQDRFLYLENNELGSVIENERIQYRHKRKLSLLNKIIRELVRPFKQLVDKIYRLSHYHKLSFTPINPKDYR